MITWNLINLVLFHLTQGHFNEAAVYYRQVNERTNRLFPDAFANDLKSRLKELTQLLHHAHQIAQQYLGTTHTATVVLGQNLENLQAGLMQPEFH